jgi:hypothetical protein
MAYQIYFYRQWKLFPFLIMFGNSYSKQSIVKAAGLILNLDESLENELHLNPVEGIPFQDEYLPITFFGGSKKRAKAKIRHLFTTGAMSCILTNEFDGKDRHFHKFVQEVFDSSFNYGVGMKFSKKMFKLFKKDFKNPTDITFQKGVMWASSHYYEYL